MRFHWLAPSFLGIAGSLLLTSSAYAASLQSWRFNISQNQLVFTTNGDVQPRAQLIANPTRLVIDLPGTTVEQPMVSQPVGGGIREVRVGQFDAQTARIVVEMNPGYTLDPQRVQVRGATPSQWMVQLPTPQQVDPGVNPSPLAETSASPAGGAPSLNAATQLEAIRVTPDGFFVRTSGATPQIEVNRSRDRRQITIDLQNTAVSPQIAQLEQAVNRFGVDRLSIAQTQTSPPTARVTLDLSDPDTNWNATVSSLGGVVIVPTGGSTSGSTASATGQTQPVSPVPQVPAPRQPATIQAVELTGGTQLLVRADQPLTYTTGWDRATTAYRITIPNARLSAQVAPPTLPANSPLLRVRLVQQDEQTVNILLLPAAGVQIGEVNQPSSQTLALSLHRGQSASVPSPIRPIPVSPPVTSGSPVPLPNVPNSRIVVVVDPGHGGSDPGAIGIDGLREKDITLILARQVAALLQQQGIQAVLTRSSDRDVELQPRVDIAEQAHADLFVSIHLNAISMSRPDVNGTGTYYYGSGSQSLAQTIQNSVVQGTGMYDRGIHTARFYVLRNTSMPAVLVEVGFITGRDDEPRLANPTFQNQMAAAIARGILQYVQQNF